VRILLVLVVLAGWWTLACSSDSSGSSEDVCGPLGSPVPVFRLPPVRGDDDPSGGTDEIALLDCSELEVVARLPVEPLEVAPGETIDFQPFWFLAETGDGREGWIWLHPDGYEGDLAALDEFEFPDEIVRGSELRAAGFVFRAKAGDPCYVEGARPSPRLQLLNAGSETSPRTVTLQTRRGSTVVETRTLVLRRGLEPGESVLLLAEVGLAYALNPDGSATEPFSDVSEEAPDGSLECR
jgi:hypothetical protein